MLALSPCLTWPRRVPRGAALLASHTPALVFNAQLVIHLAHAGHRSGQNLRLAPGLQAVHSAPQGHIALVDIDFHVAGIELAMPGHALANILVEALIRVLITTRPKVVVGPGQVPGDRRPAIVKQADGVGPAKCHARLVTFSP